MGTRPKVYALAENSNGRKRGIYGIVEVFSSVEEADRVRSELFGKPCRQSASGRELAGWWQVQDFEIWEIDLR